MSRVALPNRASYTQMATYNRCRFKFWLKYVKGVQVKGKGMGLLKGTLLHEAYDKYLFNGRVSHKDAFDHLDVIAQQEIEKGVDPSTAEQGVHEATQVLNHYLPWADANDNFQVIIPNGQQQCETSGTLPLKLADGTVRDIFFKIDEIIMIDGQLGMMENKFRKNLDNSGLEHDLQILLYQACWNQIHPENKLNFVLYNIVGTTPRKKDNAIAVRSTFYRGEAEQRIGLRNAASVLLEMNRAAEAEHQVWPLNPQKECNWDCEFLGLCLGVRAGATLDEYVGMGTYYLKGQEPPQEATIELTE